MIGKNILSKEGLMHKMAFYLKGVHLPHNKNTAGMSAVRMDPPKTVTIPMSMHIGAPADPIVKAGDEVFVGTVIAEQSGFVSSRIHSSVSGKVASVSDFLLSNGRTVSAVTITSDGEMTPDPSIKPVTFNSRDELIEAIKNSGIVGLGGAGFPTSVKFATDKPINELIINGAECEPYITSDTVTMLERADDMELAIKTLVEYFNISRVIIGIENNKPEAITSMKKMSEENDKISVKVLPPVYPQGGEKVLVYHTTGKVIPQGGLPIDVGCVVCNCTTIAAIGSYLKTGMPLVEKCITVDGGAVKEPKNVIVPIGTSAADVFEFCGGFKCEPSKVLYGGPMMGISVPDLTAPVLKNTNALLAFDEVQTALPKTTACIRCGECLNHCPFGINPTAIAKAYKNEDFEKLVSLGLELCMECGCCSYVCPASRPLVQNNRLAKQALAQHRKKEEK